MELYGFVQSERPIMISEIDVARVKYNTAGCGAITIKPLRTPAAGADKLQYSRVSAGGSAVGGRGRVRADVEI